MEEAATKTLWEILKELDEDDSDVYTIKEGNQ